MKRFVLLLLFAALAIPLLTCSDDSIPTDPTEDTGNADDPSLPSQPAAGLSAQVAIFDGVHNGGNPHFYFRPPLVADPGTSGIFDGSLEPIVRICELDGDECVGPPLAEFYANGNGKERVRVDLKKEQYKVNWDAQKAGLRDGAVYQIQVEVPGVLLGYVNVTPGPSDTELRLASTGEAIGLSGGSLPIKFRVEEGALPVSLEIVSGDDQIGWSGQELSDRLVVVAANSWSVPLPGVSILFAAGIGDGEASETLVLTDANGEASVAWRLGSSGENTLQGEVAEISSVTFRATAVSGELSNSETFWHGSAYDPTFVTIPLEDGEVLQLFGLRDASGAPERLVGLRKFAIGTPVSDWIMYDGMGNPVEVSLRDGTAAHFDYSEGTQVQVSLTAGGESVDFSVPLTSPVQAIAPQLLSTSVGRSNSSALTANAAISASQSLNCTEGLCRLDVQATFIHGDERIPVVGLSPWAEWYYGVTSGSLPLQPGQALQGQSCAGGSVDGSYCGSTLFNSVPTLPRDLCPDLQNLIEDACDPAVSFDDWKVACLAVAASIPPLAGACATVFLTLKISCELVDTCADISRIFAPFLDPRSEEPLLVYGKRPYTSVGGCNTNSASVTFSQPIPWPAWAGFEYACSGMDDDMDGVLSPADRCPNSEPDSEVDTDGCEVIDGLALRLGQSEICEGHATRLDLEVNGLPATEPVPMNWSFSENSLVRLENCEVYRPNSDPRSQCRVGGVSVGSNDPSAVVTITGITESGASGSANITLKHCDFHTIDITLPSDPTLQIGGPQKRFYLYAEDPLGHQPLVEGDWEVGGIGGSEIEIVGAATGSFVDVRGISPGTASLGVTFDGQSENVLIPVEDQGGELAVNLTGPTVLEGFPSPAGLECQGSITATGVGDPGAGAEWSNHLLEITHQPEGWTQTHPNWPVNWHDDTWTRVLHISAGETQTHLIGGAVIPAADNGYWESRSVFTYTVEGTGETKTVEHSFECRPPDDAPTVTISSPADGASVYAGRWVEFSGESTDPQDGSIPADSHTWTSTLDGVLVMFGMGGVYGSPNLSVGHHLITLAATDSDGNEGVAGIDLFITTPPGDMTFSFGAPDVVDGQIYPGGFFGDPELTHVCEYQLTGHASGDPEATAEIIESWREHTLGYWSYDELTCESQDESTPCLVHRPMWVPYRGPYLRMASSLRYVVAGANFGEPLRSGRSGAIVSYTRDQFFFRYRVLGTGVEKIAASTPTLCVWPDP